MLYAIAGSQGSGKSTTINELKSLGYPCIERKTSRSILKDWNVTLDEVNTNPKLTVKFQEAITEMKYLDEAAHLHTNGPVFTERTHMDLFAYTVVALGGQNKYDNWINDYYIKCAQYSSMYERVFFLRGGLFDVEEDGTRGHNKHYSRMMDITMLDYTQQAIDDDKLDEIITSDLHERADSIIARL